MIDFAGAVLLTMWALAFFHGLMGAASRDEKLSAPARALADWLSWLFGAGAMGCFLTMLLLLVLDLRAARGPPNAIRSRASCRSGRRAPRRSCNPSSINAMPRLGCFPFARSTLEWLVPCGHLVSPLVMRSRPRSGSGI